MRNRLPYDALDIARIVGVTDKPEPTWAREPRTIPPRKKPTKRNPRRKTTRPAGPPSTVSVTEARITSIAATASILVSSVAMLMATHAHDIAIATGGK